MTLQDIFDHLTYGELSQLHIGGLEEQGITEENRHRVITHVSLGLNALHRRFFLRRGEQKVYVMPAMATYMLDAPDMFKIEQAYDSEENELPIGTGSEDSLSLDSMNTLRVPLDIRMKNKPITVIYRADHPKLDKRAANRDPERTEIELPASHTEALLYFIASRMFNPMGAANVEFHEGNNYAQKYEQACRALENQGMQISDSVEQTKFQRNGWV